MAKRSKWLKWQLGGGATLALSLILNAIRSDPAFAAAHLKALAAKDSGQPDQQMAPQSDDSVFQEFQQDRPRNRQQQSDGRGGATGRRFGGQNPDNQDGNGSFERRRQPRRQRDDEGDLFGQGSRSAPASPQQGNQMSPQSPPAATQPLPHTRTRRS